MLKLASFSKFNTIQNYGKTIIMATGKEDRLLDYNVADGNV